MAITSMPTIRHVLDSGITILNLTAGSAILAGQAVEAAGTGVSEQVVPGTGATAPAGVALYDAADGAPVAVASIGCVVTVASEDAVDAGDWVTPAAAGGGDPAGGLVKVIAATQDALGFAIDDIAADGTGRIMVVPSPYVAAS